MKDFITTKILNKLNIPDSNKAKFSYFVNNGYIDEYNEIMLKTDFLNEDCQFTERIYCIMNDITTPHLCDNCKTEKTKFKNYSKGYFTYCSCKCVNNNETVSSKRKDTNLKKYGVETVFQSTEIQNKSKNTMLDKYGVTSAILVPEFKQKIKDTNKEKYGTEFAICSDIVKEKIKESNKEKYGAEVHNFNINANKFLSNKEWLANELNLKPVKIIAKEIGCVPTFVNHWARKHNLQSRIPQYSEEYEIRQFLIEECGLSIDSIICNSWNFISKNGKRRQLDIFLPEYNIAIELNGLYYHRDNKTRHLDKLNLCEEKGIRLLQFWDYQWNTKQEICKSIIKNHLKLNQTIYARKCSIVELSSKDYTTFLQNNHIHGNVNALYKYGLLYDGELVSVIGLSKSRYNKNYDFELIRYANKLNLNVVGGFSKLLKFFRGSKKGSILSYCDKMLFTGSMYNNYGFVLEKHSPPNCFYFDKHLNIKSRESLQKHKLKDILANFDENLTANENLKNNGWNIVWDCGNIVWVLN